jgi:hypothetical protein
VTDHNEQGPRPEDDAAAKESRTTADPIEVEAAEIDPRSPDAAEQIEELKDDAEELGRDVKDPPA